MSLLDMPPGLYPSVETEIYHQRHLGMVSKSALDYLLRSPAHYKAWVDGELHDESTEALEFGAAFHCALLEPERFAKTYASEPEFGDCRRKENKAARDSWRADNGGKKPISALDMGKIERMSAAIHAHPLAGKMIRDGEPELTVRWDDPDTGLKCKARADYYVRRLGMIADVKSTMDARTKAFQRDVLKRGYHMQDSLYRAGFSENGNPVQHFIFICVEKEPPHAIMIHKLDQKFAGIGYVAVREAMDTMAHCLKTSSWPGYDETIQTCDAPPWAA